MIETSQSGYFEENTRRCKRFSMPKMYNSDIKGKSNQTRGLTKLGSLSGDGDNY